MQIRQYKLVKKLSLFLTTLGDEDLSKYSEGLCNAFAFLNFRAALIGQEDKNLKRMEKVMKMDEKTIQVMAQSYQEYKNARRLLIDGSWDNKILQKLNRQLDMLNLQLTDLRTQHMQLKKLNKFDEKLKELEDKIRPYEEEVRKVRDEREKLIKAVLRKNCSEVIWKQINEAEEFYIYIHTIVGAFDPGEYMNFHIGKKYVNQNDFIEILQLLPPDVLLKSGVENEAEHKRSDSKDEKEAEIPDKKVFEIAFNFTKDELIKIFSDNEIIHDGDFIVLGSTDHSMFLSYTNGEFKLYETGLVELKDSHPETLVAAIQYHFFTQFRYNSEYMPVGISIFDKTGAERPNRVKLIKEILEQRSDKNVDLAAWDGVTAAWMAAKYGHVDTLELLIQNKADLSKSQFESGMSPILMAAQNGYVNVIVKLVELKADLNIVDAKVNTPISVAARLAHAEAVQSLIDAKANVNTLNHAGNTPVSVAAEAGHANIVKTLIEAKADFNTPNLDNCTPVWKAAQDGHIHVLETLIAAKADIIQPDIEDCTPVWIAAQNGHGNIIKLLSDAKADLDTPNKDGYTPAIMAAINDKASAIQVLLDGKADLNKPDASGLTPLHRAIKKGSFKAITVLLECGVITNIKDKYDKLPIDYAANDQVKYFVILQMLKVYIDTFPWQDKSARAFALMKFESMSADWMTSSQNTVPKADEKKSLSTHSMYALSAKGREAQSFLKWISFLDKIKSSPDRLYANISKALLIMPSKKIEISKETKPLRNSH